MARLLFIGMAKARWRMRRIGTSDHVAAGLAALLAADPRLVAIAQGMDELPLRLTRPGLESLASIIVSQQVSRASADAIFGRLVTLVDPLTAPALGAAGEAVFRQAGLSRPKQRTLLALATAVAQGLDLESLVLLPAGEAMARLTAVPGIGPWTAEVYLLSAAGHPDIFPARDVALQAAAADALGLAARPGHRELAAIAESWAPWRSVAARLLWSHYRRMKGRDAAPI
jgi:DNA-3-methyladenine glycosylase II